MSERVKQQEVPFNSRIFQKKVGPYLSGVFFWSHNRLSYLVTRLILLLCVVPNTTVSLVYEPQCTVIVYVKVLFNYNTPKNRVKFGASNHDSLVTVN